MSYVAFLLALALNPALASDDEPDDDIAWGEDGDIALQRGAVRTAEKGAAAPAPKPADEDEDEPAEDEPDDDATDVHDVARTPPPQVTTTHRPGEDDFQFEEPVAPPPAVVIPGPVALEVVGKEPLANNYPASVVAVDRDSVVIELPVLVAKSRAGTEPFQLVASVFVGATKVGEVRQSFDPAFLAEASPTFAFLKVAAPVAAPKGEIKVVVAKAKADGTGPADLFTQTVPYQLR